MVSAGRLELVLSDGRSELQNAQVLRNIKRRKLAYFEHIMWAVTVTYKRQTSNFVVGEYKEMDGNLC